MKLCTTLFVLLLAVALPAQSNPKAVLRQQTFGIYTSFATIDEIKFDSTDLVVFANGYRITKDEFLSAFYSTAPSDSGNARKVAYLDKYTANYRKAFEAMDQGLDTTMKFQLDYLTYKQELITPYLNEGKTRVEAEALPAVKFALRKYYVDQLVKMLMNKEVWVPQSDAVLEDFYNSHLSLYQGQPFSVSKTKVIYDWQKEKETELNGRINPKFPAKVNADLLKSL